MKLDEAIKHAEEVAKEQAKLCKRYDDASGYTRSHNEEIRTSEAKKCEKCAEEHRQIAEWLRELKQLRRDIENTKQEIEYQAKKFNQRPEISYDTAYQDGLYGALTIIDNRLKVKEVEG